MSGIAEDELRIAVMRADLLLKSKQAFWETPRNIALLLTAVAAIAGLAGWQIGSTPRNVIVHLDAPLTITSPRAP